jgi:uncharacterized protein YbaP (TraB family)
VKRLLHAIAVALLALAGTPPAAAAERGILWSVRGEQNTVYLLGSIHVLRPTDLGLAGAAEAAYEDACLLYTSPSPRDRQKSRMPSSA